MKKLARALGVLLVLGQAGSGPPAAADVPAGADPRLACATTFAVTAVAGDPNAVVVRVTDPADPLHGKITAFGHDRTWTGTVDRAAIATRFNVRESSVLVRADAPIEAMTYEPERGSCTFRAGTRARNGYDGNDVQRPEVTVSGAQPLEPVACAQPYVSPTVLHASEPQTPAMAAQQGILGTVRVGVALDERGMPQSLRVISSPSVILNLASLEAARRSTYAGAVFRCAPVPSGYEFAIEFGA